MGLTLLGGWDFLNEHVQTITDTSDFISAESSVLCAGPSKLEFTNGDYNGMLVPIGVVQNAQVTQNKQIQQLFEIGSRKPFFIPGRTLIQVGISRVLFDGPSLMRAVYDYDTTTVVSNDDAADVVDPVHPYDPDGGESGAFYINLASEFFNRPIGLGFIIRDSRDNAYGGFYLEECYIQTHSMTLAGQQTVLLENVGIRASALIPFAGVAHVPPEDN